MTFMSLAKRLMRCCGRWKTKSHRKCEKQTKVGRSGSCIEGSENDSIGTPTFDSAFRHYSVCCYHCSYQTGLRQLRFRKAT